VQVRLHVGGTPPTQPERSAPSPLRRGALRSCVFRGHAVDRRRYAATGETPVPRGVEARKSETMAMTPVRIGLPSVAA
jgi:hypothetical protein